MTMTPQTAFGELYSHYASGRLDPAFALLLETQAALRSDISAALATGEAIAGEFLEREAAVDLSASAIDRAMEAIDAVEAAQASHQSAAGAAATALDEVLDLPAPVHEAALYALSDKGWRMVGPGIHRLPLDIHSAASAEIYRIQPDCAVPRHSHSGTELTLVLAGGFTDETGAFGPGDLAVKGPDDTHQPVADAGHVCFTLAIREGGLRFTGIMGLVQKALGR